MTTKSDRGPEMDEGDWLHTDQDDVWHAHNTEDEMNACRTAELEEIRRQIEADA